LQGGETPQFSWQRFTLEINPLKLGADTAAAVDGLLVIE